MYSFGTILDWPIFGPIPIKITSLIQNFVLNTYISYPLSPSQFFMMKIGRNTILYIYKRSMVFYLVFYPFLPLISPPKQPKKNL